jgi:hypothetical protein
MISINYWNLIAIIIAVFEKIDRNFVFGAHFFSQNIHIRQTPAYDG